MNSTQRKALEEAVSGVNPTTIPLHRFESILGLKGTLVDLQRACDPENGQANSDSDLAEWEGKKSPQLWCLMEAYDDYKRAQVPSDPSAYLKAKMVNKSVKIKVSGAQATLISEFFVFINKAFEEWEKTKHKIIKSGSRQSTPKMPVQELKNEISAEEVGEDKSSMEQSIKPASLSDAISSVFQMAAADTDKRITAMFALFTERVIEKIEKKEELTREFIVNLASSVSGITFYKMEAALGRVKKNDKTEAKNAEEKLKRAKGPFCGYTYGKKSKNNGKTCNEYCVDATLYPNKEGKMVHLCVKHIKTAATKHTCQFPDKHGNCCGKRIPDDVTVPYSRPGQWKGVTYSGMWICGQHLVYVNKNLDKSEHPCCSKNSKGKQCSRVAKKNADGTWTKKCTTCTNQDERKNNKKASDRRKALKSGKNKTKDEVIVSEENVDEKKENEQSNKSKKRKNDSESEDESGNESGDESGSESGDESGNESGDESDSDSEDKEENKSEENKDEEKLTINVRFNLKKFKEADWTLKRLENDSNEKFNCFIDVNSGLVCYNAKNTESETPINTELTALGVWNNKAQLYTKLSKPSIKYAKKLGVICE